MARIRRITITPVRVPVPRERINCPEFAAETLNTDEKGNWGGEWFGDVPFYVIRVEGDGGPSGWADSSRAIPTCGGLRARARHIRCLQILYFTLYFISSLELQPMVGRIW